MGDELEVGIEGIRPNESPGGIELAERTAEGIVTPRSAVVEPIDQGQQVSGGAIGKLVGRKGAEGGAFERGQAGIEARDETVRQAPIRVLVEKWVETVRAGGQVG